jgi:hypothetical protein
MAGRRFGFALMVCGLALASCVSAEELHRQDEATCTGYGFHPGTDAFANCMQRENLARQAVVSYPPPPYWGGGYWGGVRGPYWP